jgi:hypothetical protein
MNANSPSSAPQCQGCMQKPAQFVCAGCGNQWYCSKDCQVRYIKFYFRFFCYLNNINLQKC